MLEPRRFSCLPLLLSLHLSTQPAWTWGRDGHRMVAKIATLQLTPATRAKLAAILQTDDAGLASAMAGASTWPDEISKRDTGSGNWHFINVPVTGPFSMDGLCGTDGTDCAPARIKDFSDRLRNNTAGFLLREAPQPMRPMVSQELAFLIHLVGDIHQPLHAAGNADRGGNCIRLTQGLKHEYGGYDANELHAVWDVETVLAVFDHQDRRNRDRSVSDEDHVTAELFALYRKQAPAAWEKAGVDDWVRESNALARTNIYQKLQIPAYTAAPGQCAEGIAPVSITDQYLRDNVDTTEQQLMRAGIRLGNLLNEICAGDGCKATTTHDRP
jgi:hypothetical protein